MLALADSFLVAPVQGVPHAHGLNLHLQRFTHGLHELGFTGSVQPFLSDAIEQIDKFTRARGNAFPRLECWRSESGLSLAIALRKAPPLTTTIAFTPAPTTVADSSARLKGPNIEHYGALMSEHGGEVLLTTSDGIATEGTTTSLIWWEGDTLTTVARELPRVASITELLVLEIARTLGIDTATARRTPKQLEAVELWAVNALHGIRVVSGSHPPSDTDRLALFREQYAALARPLSLRSADPCERSR